MFITVNKNANERENSARRRAPLEQQLRHIESVIRERKKIVEYQRKRQQPKTQNTTLGVNIEVAKTNDSRQSSFRDINQDYIIASQMESAATTPQQLDASELD